MNSIFYKSIESSKCYNIYLKNYHTAKERALAGEKVLICNRFATSFVNQGFAKRKVEPNVKPLWDPENDTKWRLNDTNSVKTVQIT